MTVYTEVVIGQGKERNRGKGPMGKVIGTNVSEFPISKNLSTITLVPA
jgi:hypothetical protein